MVKNLEFMEIPRVVIFGPGAISNVSKVVSKFTGSRSIVVVSGGVNTSKIASDKVLPLLVSDYNVEFLRIGSMPCIDATKLFYDKLRKNKDIGLLLGVGGGKVLDVTKTLAFLLGVEYVSIPTSAANDGIASPSLSYLLKVDFEKTFGRPISMAKAPIAVLADTEIISKAPYITLQAGCGDLLAKFVAVRDWELAYKLKGEDYSEYAASMALMSAELIVRKAAVIKVGGEEGARIVVKALIGSGVAMSIAGSSRPASGSEHLFSHALDLLSRKYGFKPAPHGLQCGVGAIMMMWLHGGDWERIRNVLRKIGAPTTARGLGIDSKYIIKALTMAHQIRPSRYTILGESGLTKEAAERLAKETGVI